MKTLRKKLENPFVLVAQGFVVGTILFWATAPQESIAQAPAPVAVSAPAQG